MAGEITPRAAGWACGAARSATPAQSKLLHSAFILLHGWAVRGRGEGRGVRCTRGWFRIATASIPWHYRWGERGRWHSANGKWQTEGVGGRHARRHWSELWHGS